MNKFFDYLSSVHLALRSSRNFFSLAVLSALFSFLSRLIFHSASDFKIFGGSGILTFGQGKPANARAIAAPFSLQSASEGSWGSDWEATEGRKEKIGRRKKRNDSKTNERDMEKINWNKWIIWNIRIIIEKVWKFE